MDGVVICGNYILRACIECLAKSRTCKDLIYEQEIRLREQTLGYWGRGLGSTAGVDLQAAPQDCPMKSGPGGHASRIAHKGDVLLGSTFGGDALGHYLRVY